MPATPSRVMSTPAAVEYHLKYRNATTDQTVDAMAGATSTPPRVPPTEGSGAATTIATDHGMPTDEGRLTPAAQVAAGPVATPPTAAAQAAGTLPRRLTLAKRPATSANVDDDDDEDVRGDRLVSVGDDDVRGGAAARALFEEDVVSPSAVPHQPTQTRPSEKESKSTKTHRGSRSAASDGPQYETVTPDCDVLNRRLNVDAAPWAPATTTADRADLALATVLEGVSLLPPFHLRLVRESAATSRYHRAATRSHPRAARATEEEEEEDDTDVKSRLEEELVSDEDLAPHTAYAADYPWFAHGEKRACDYEVQVHITGGISVWLGVTPELRSELVVQLRKKAAAAERHRSQRPSMVLVIVPFSRSYVLGAATRLRLRGEPAKPVAVIQRLATATDAAIERDNRLWVEQTRALEVVQDRLHSDRQQWSGDRRRFLKRVHVEAVSLSLDGTVCTLVLSHRSITSQHTWVTQAVLTILRDLFRFRRQNTPFLRIVQMPCVDIFTAEGR